MASGGRRGLSTAARAGVKISLGILWVMCLVSGVTQKCEGAAQTVREVGQGGCAWPSLVLKPGDCPWESSLR